MRRVTTLFDGEAYGPNFLAGCLIEDEERGPAFTGLLSSKGKLIFKLFPPKPKFGFPIHPEDNDGYQFDPEDYVYVELSDDE